MNAIRLSIRMALRRRTAAILTVVFTWVMTAFLLAYPALIGQVQAQLDHAYDTLPVEGWIINIAGYEEPTIPPEVWKPITKTGLLQSWRAKGAGIAQIPYASTLEAIYREAYPGAPLPPQESVLPLLMPLALGVDMGSDYGDFVGINDLRSVEQLSRMAGKIIWAEGYGPECLAGEDMVCLLPESDGYALGSAVTFQLRPDDDKMIGKETALTLTVAGTYEGNPVAGVAGFCPLAALEALFSENGWDELTLSSFYFTPADNRQLPQLKDALESLGLSGEGEDAKLRAAIDDRVLQGTVAPIKSNLGLLKGLYSLFFGAVALIGFFICFLQAKGRKPDYAVMRLLGEPAGSITAKALLEQAALCILGVILGAALLAVTGKAAVSPLVCVGIWACYTLGAGFAVGMTVRVNVMEILRDKE